MRQRYDSAQICINGHVINSMAGTDPTHNKKYCEDCGAETITNCKSCNAPIKGSYHYPNILPMGLGYDPPKFCDNCGNPLPWTENKLKAAKELGELTDSLSAEEKVDLQSSIEDLVKDTPNVPVAQIKVKKYLTKAGKEITQGMRDILIDLVSETIRRTIWMQ